MSISSVSQGVRPQSLQETLTSSLQGQGLSADKSASISSELESVAKSTLSASPGATDPRSVRAALEDQLSKDVEAGTLTADEADQVRSALDDFESQMAANRPAGGPPSGGVGGPPPGGGGSEDVEATEDDDDSDNEKTALELLLEKLQEASQGTDTSKTKDYLTQLMSQGLVDLKA